jgi:hypothetical protein
VSDTPSPAPALLALRDAIDARWPSRAKASDGIMGDAAHQARASDHNQGNALDVTHDPANGPDLEALAAALIGDERVHYVIWNKRIRNRAFEDGAWRLYTGANPHTKHLHVSVSAEHREDTSPWKLAADDASATGAAFEAHGSVEQNATPAGGPVVDATASTGEAEEQPSRAGFVVFVAGLGLLGALALLHFTATAEPRRRPRAASPAWS